MTKITVDKNKAVSCKLNEIDPEDLQAVITGAAQEAESEVEALDSTINLAAIGGTYQVGPIDSIVALGHIVLLNEIDSPFTNGKLGEEGDDLDPIDCYKALYVLALGQDAIRPIMAMKERIKAMLMLKPMVEKDPSLFQQLLDRTEKIADAAKEFEEAAVNYYTEHFVGYDLQETIDGLFSALSDMVKVADDMPSEEADGKKKD